MIVLKDTGSDFFEEAYFVLKSHRTAGKIRTEQDFVAEANRIVREAAYSGIDVKTQTAKKNKVLFFCGMLCGIVLCSICVIALKFAI